MQQTCRLFLAGSRGGRERERERERGESSGNERVLFVMRCPLCTQDTTSADQTSSSKRACTHFSPVFEHTNIFSASDAAFTPLSLSESRKTRGIVFFKRSPSSSSFVYYVLVHTHTQCHFW